MPLTKIMPILTVACLAFTCGCASKTAKTPDGPAYETFRQSNGTERSYYLHLPYGFDAKKHYPLVLILHGGGKGDGGTAAKYLGFDAVADREGFVALYPNGINAQWNDGRGTNLRGTDLAGIDDVAYLSELIRYMHKRYGTDPRNVFVTGASNGGMMTLRLGCEIAPQLTAVAPVIANIPKNIIGQCRPGKPLPVLLMNGTEDPLVPWNGGFVTSPVGKKKGGAVVSTEETVAFWRKADHCTSPGKTEPLPDRNKDDRSHVEITRYQACADDTKVILYRVIGGGHHIPGTDVREFRRLLGNKNMDFRASEAIWDFFASYKH